MTNEQKIFDDVMKSQGGIYIPKGNYEIDMLLDSMLQIAKEHIEVTNILNKHLPKVYIYYTNNMSINACAFKVESQYFISVNVGTVIKLKDIFDKIAADKNICRGVFNDEEEKCNSATLLYFAMIFLASHEHNHIRFGHCDLINHLYGNTEINFLNEATSNSLANDGLFRQTLEYDADCCAISNLINRQLMSREYYNRDFNEFSHGIALCLLSCYILFKIFDNGEHSSYEYYDLDNLDRSTHPRPGIRINYIIYVLSSLLCKYYDDENVKEVFDRIFEYLKIFENTLGNEIKMKKLEIGIGYTNKGDQHIKNIHNNWRYVRQLLEPFTNDTLTEFEEITGLNKFVID